MRLLAVLEEYIQAVMQRAEIEIVDDTIVARIPEAPGLVAAGADRVECVLDLYQRLDESVDRFVGQSSPLPIIDDIDLNTDSAPSIIRSRACRPIAPPGEFFENELELEAAFDGCRMMNATRTRVNLGRDRRQSRSSRLGPITFARYRNAITRYGPGVAVTLSLPAPVSPRFPRPSPGVAVATGSAETNWRLGTSK
jgi:hypothetical protein